MSATVADAQVRTYLAAVKEHLDDLPDDERDELLEDLEEHLLEVAAEDDGSLEQRLGPPGVYAEELRASAGLPSRDQLAARRPSQRVADRLARSGVWRSATRFAESSQLRALRGFVRELLPGWWVLRGYLVVTALVVITDETGRDDIPFPSVVDSQIVGIICIVLAIVASVWLGRRSQRGTRERWLSILLSIAIAVVATAAFVQGSATNYAYAEDVPSPGLPYLHHEDGVPIANVCPYSSDGKLLADVLLFDQNGRPIINTAGGLPDGRPVQLARPSLANAYPRALVAPDEFGRPQPLECPASIGAAVRAGAPSPAASPGG